jgi:hypothetical protein
MGLYTEWRFSPFRADESLVYFLKNVTGLSPVTLAMIAAGAFFAYWLGRDSGFRLFPGKQRPADLIERQHSPPSN